jgi:hypothetical protein
VAGVRDFDRAAIVRHFEDAIVDCEIPSMASLIAEFAAGHARECYLRTWPAQFIAEHASENRKRNLALNVP